MYIQDIKKHFRARETRWYFFGGLSLGAAVTAWSIMGLSVLAGQSDLVRAQEEPDFIAPLSSSPRVTPLAPAQFTQPYTTRGIYLSPAVVGNDERLAIFLARLKDSNINTVVVDLKDFEGDLTFVPEDPSLQPYTPDKPWVKNMPDRVRQLHQLGLYTIARLPVFNDSAFAKINPAVAIQHAGTNKIWRDSGGNAWLDPASKTVWAYNALLAFEAKRLGFDEVNFDYVRFPSDGALKQMQFPVWDGVGSRYDVMRSFFQYLNDTVRSQGIVTSVDVFGMVLLRDNGLDIGQRLADVLANFDYVMPMMYPSHYPRGFAGLANPAANPGQVIAAGFGKAVAMLPAFPDSRIRPWLQDFDIGAHYNLPQIKAQIKASDEAGGVGWLLWNASNKYTEGIFTADFN